MTSTSATPQAVDESVQVKGTPVHALVAFLDRRLTPEQKARVIRTVPPAAADLLSRKVILSLQTFPLSALNRITETAARVCGTPVDVFAREVGRAAADEAVHGIWRVAASMLTPTTLLAKGSRLWSTIYSQGRLEVDKRGSGEAIVTLHEFPCEAVCCERITGWFERLFEISRAKNIRIRQTDCYAKGAPACRWLLLWE